MTITPYFNHLWQSTLFAVVVGLLALALRKNRAQVRYSLWLAASLKFLIPFSVFVAAGTHLMPVVSAPIAQSVLPRAVQEIGKTFVVPPVLVSSTGSGTTSLIPAVLFGVWLCGFASVLVRWSRNWLHIRAAVRRGRPAGVVASVRIVSSAALLEPSIFGILRPVLLLPEGITRQLAPVHLEAIVAHELCHARRRDNLAAAIHMLVEALFWFHPLVWWIGARLVEERERACDEEVIRQGNQPDVYAESILKTCQFYVESPLTCVSGVTGSDLKKRIVRIMTQSITVRLSPGKKLLLASAAITAVALPLAVGLTNESRVDNTPRASFEVASIKPTKAGTEGTMVHVQPGGRLTATNVPLELLLEEAYHVTKYQIVGAPPWVVSDHFDIVATPGEAAGAAIDKLPPEQRLDRMIEMVRSLLADRFKLVLGHETKQLPVYALVVAKNGPSFHPSVYQADAKSMVGTVPEKPPQGIYFTGAGKLTISNGDIPSFAKSLSGTAVDRIVVDRTGLAGKYDFTLNWTPDSNEGPRMPGGPPPQARDVAPRESNGPSLFTAIQEQLGLKLEPQKAAVDVLVIEHVEKPSAN